MYAMYKRVCGSHEQEIISPGHIGSHVEVCNISHTQEFEFSIFETF